jgi:uncharacterized protein (DUF2384 family)
MGRRVYIRDKKIAGKPGWWPEKKKIEALTTFLATGSQAHTSAIIGVPEETVRLWRKSDWWAERTKEFKSDNSLVLDNKLAKIMDKALDAVVDRIENGEYIFDPRTGITTRVPPKLRDVQKVASDMIDKKALLEKITKGKEDTKQAITADHLVMLAREFAKFANGGREPAEAQDLKSVIEGEHEEIFEQLGVETSNGSI